MRRNERGFTLMELLVVIVIVAILAAVAVPLYINYVNDAQRTEAKGAIGAIITAQQAYLQKNLGTGYASSLETLEEQGLVDIREAKANWTFTVTADGADGFEVVAAGVGGDNRPPTTLGVTYTFTREGGGVWDDTPVPAP